jgi:hypothetical protein
MLMLRLVILLALVLQEPAKEKYEIRVRPAAGDRLEVVDKWSHTFRGKLGDENVRFSSRGGRRMTVETEKVENGRASRKTVKVADAFMEQQDAITGKYVRKDEAIHGRTATIERRGDREERTGLDGVPDAEQRALGLDDPLTRLFPDKAVAIGETWEISGEGIKTFFPSGDFTDGRIVVTLRDVKEVGGRKCALLGTNYDVSSKDKDGVTRELRLLGTLTVWLDRGYILEMAQSGRMITSGGDPKNHIPNGEAVVTGELKATVLEMK